MLGRKRREQMELFVAGSLERLIPKDHVLGPGGSRTGFELAAEEVAADCYSDARGRRAVVRDGYLPAREVLTGIGPVTVRVPRTRDRSGSGIKFNSRLLPPYLRRTKQTMELLPWLYLKGVSTGATSLSMKSQVY